MENNQSTKKRNYERYLDGETWSPSTGYEQDASDAAFMQDESSPYYVPEENNAYSGYEAASSSSSSYTSYETSPSSVPSGVGYQGLEEPVSMGEWALCIFLNCIPCVGLIMMFVWAFGKDSKKSKSNFFKVQLIFMGIILALYLVLFLFVLGMGIAMG